MKLRLVFGTFICLALVATAVGEDHGRKLRATLRGFSETPPNSTPATGTFRATISPDESSINFELTYSGLTNDSRFSHIHFGTKFTTGGVMIFFCDNPPQGAAAQSPRSCPLRAGTVTGTVTAADVIGPTGQGISAKEFSKVLDAIRSGLSYVNVHSVPQFPGGEIRGQVRVSGDDDDDD